MASNVQHHIISNVGWTTLHLPTLEAPSVQDHPSEPPRLVRSSSGTPKNAPRKVRAADPSLALPVPKKKLPCQMPKTGFFFKEKVIDGQQMDELDELPLYSQLAGRVSPAPPSSTAFRF